MELWEAVYIAKNLKGFYLPHRKGWKDDIKFLRKKFRYRRIGVLSQNLDDLGIPVESPLYPLGSDFLSLSLKYKDIPRQLADLLPFSSIFMVPVLCSSFLRDEIGKLLLWSLSLPRVLSPGEFRFNLRLLTYLPIDMAPKDAKAHREAISRGEWVSYREKRSQDIVRDAEKRFWRLREDAGSGIIRLGIIEPLRFITDPPKEEDIPFLLPSGIIFTEG